MNKPSFLIKCRLFQTRYTSSFFITTPIFYVNASPHIGHLYTSLIADASHRFEKLKNPLLPSVFSTGTDEHGTKIQQAAQQNNLPPDKYCAQITSQYKELFKNFNICYTDFVHTSEERHKKTVKAVWERLVENGHIIKGSYSGWYCDADESFLSDDQISTQSQNGKEVKVSAESGRPVHWVQEDNYVFNLPNFKSDLISWITSGKVITPPIFEKLLLHWIQNEGVADREVSVSRPATRVHWGIPVPSDPSQTVYVWLDALVNYLTVVGYPDLNFWPPNKQVIGKDILKFHGVYWPSFLMAIGLEPPRCLAVHSHWTVDSEKMSKSRGNVVCPNQAADRYTADGLRYFLLREATPHSDSNYSDTKVTRVLNSELADTLGNLLNRCCGKTVNKWQCYPPFVLGHFEQYCLSECPDLLSSLETLTAEVDQSYSELNFYRGIAAVIGVLHKANRYFESSKPWELRKSAACEDHLLALLHVTMETLRITAICLLPIVPSLANQLLDKLSVPRAERLWQFAAPSWSKVSLATEKYPLSPENLVLYRRLVK